MPNGGSHENLERVESVKLPSERSFAIVFTVFFAIVGLFPVFTGRPPIIWAFVVSAAFLVAGLAFPAILAPFNKAWFKLGLLLHKVVSPVVLGLLYVVGILPIALALRLLGKELIPLKFDREASTYWIQRDPPGPPQDSMTRQF
jgi:glucan phosphoethanolaminetransferase (alkaline phosphatase superfamily)